MSNKDKWYSSRVYDLNFKLLLNMPKPDSDKIWNLEFRKYSRYWMLYSDKLKYEKRILKCVYGFGNINDTMNTFKVTGKQQILEIHVKTLHLKILRNNEETKNRIYLIYWLIKNKVIENISE